MKTKLADMKLTPLALRKLPDDELAKIHGYQNKQAAHERDRREEVGRLRYRIDTAYPSDIQKHEEAIAQIKAWIRQDSKRLKSLNTEVTQ